MAPAEHDEDAAGAAGAADAGADRRWAIGLGIAALAAAVFLFAGLGGPDEPPAGTSAPAATPTTRDLDTVTDDELAAVVAEHPEVVGMRLALVERYLRAGDLADAQTHAEQAAVRAQTVEDRARALRYLGWTTALLGEPEQGEGILVQSLALAPSDPDSLYFLGRIRYELLGRPDLALGPLEQLEDIDMNDDQRRLIDSLLAEVRVAANTPDADTPAGATPSTTGSAPATEAP